MVTGEPLGTLARIEGRAGAELNHRATGEEGSHVSGVQHAAGDGIVVDADERDGTRVDGGGDAIRSARAAGHQRLDPFDKGDPGFAFILRRALFDSRHARAQRGDVFTVARISERRRDTVDIRPNVFEAIGIQGNDLTLSAEPVLDGLFHVPFADGAHFTLGLGDDEIRGDSKKKWPNCS
jgi:hypothetical protein